MNKLCCSLPTGRYQISDNFAFIDFCDTPDWESPKYFFTYHNNYLASIHFTSGRNKGKRNLENAIWINLESCLTVSHYFKYSFFWLIYQFNSNNNLILKWISKLDRVRVLLKQSIIHIKGRIWNWHLACSAELVLPFSNVFRSERYFCILYGIQGWRDILNLDFFLLERFQSNIMALDYKLIWVCVGHFDCRFCRCWILELSKYWGGNSKWRF